MASKKEMHQLVRQAMLQGWIVTRTKGSHLKWTSPAGDIVISSSTPSDPRTIKNTKRDLRIRGFIEIRKK